MGILIVAVGGGRQFGGRGRAGAGTADRHTLRRRIGVEAGRAEESVGTVSVAGARAAAVTTTGSELHAQGPDIYPAGMAEQVVLAWHAEPDMGRHANHRRTGCVRGLGKAELPAGALHVGLTRHCAEEPIASADTVSRRTIGMMGAWLLFAAPSAILSIRAEGSSVTGIC